MAASLEAVCFCYRKGAIVILVMQIYVKCIAAGEFVTGLVCPIQRARLAINPIWPDQTGLGYVGSLAVSFKEDKWVRGISEGFGVIAQGRADNIASLEVNNDFENIGSDSYQ